MEAGDKVVFLLVLCASAVDEWGCGLVLVAPVVGVPHLHFQRR